MQHAAAKVTLVYSSPNSQNIVPFNNMLTLFDYSLVTFFAAINHETYQAQVTSVGCDW